MTPEEEYKQARDDTMLPRAGKIIVKRRTFQGVLCV